MPNQVFEKLKKFKLCFKIFSLMLLGYFLFVLKVYFLNTFFNKINIKNGIF